MKRLSTVFWWLIASLPLLYFIFDILIRVFFASSDSGSISSLDTCFTNTTNAFTNMVIPYLKNAFNDLFTTLELTNYTFISIIFSWFIQAFLFHLIVDFILILPKVCQKFIDKVCD